MIFGIIVKTFSAILNFFDSIFVFIYKQRSYYQIQFARKIRGLKKFKFRRSLYHIGFRIGKILRCRFIWRFFVRRTYRLKAINTHVLIKYIAKELLLYFLVCFAFFFVVFFVN